MSEHIERLTAADFDEAIDFINLVFSHAHSPTDFPSVLPKLYKPTDENMRCNFAVRRDGRIRAIVGLFPMTANIGSKQLKVGGIGGVSTHPYERKSGMMKQLMEACINEMRTEGIQISCLGGLRQRYGYFGYEKAGTSLKYEVTKTNIRHYLKGSDEIEVSFEQIREDSREHISFAKGLYEAQPFYCTRPLDEFYLYLKTWDMTPWAALDKNGNMVGYLVADKQGNGINEIIAVNPDELLHMLCTWVTKHEGNSVSISLPPWAAEFACKIGCVSESVSVREAYNWRIFDWVEVISTLFTLKLKMSQLADGQVNIGINDYGIIRIQVKDGTASCEMVQDRPDFVCDSLMATRLVFGPLSPEYVTVLPKDKSKLLSSWFPLPLHWLPQDGI